MPNASPKGLSFLRTRDNTVLIIATFP
jgi:hypothetical protein